MGTNYYLIRKMKYVPGTPTTLGLGSYDTEVTQLTNGYVCRNTYYPTLDALSKDFEQEIHIGKSSFGWHFSLCVYPEYGIHNFEDWKCLFFDFNTTIEDEYGETISPEEMIDIITDRAAPDWDKHPVPEDYEAHVLEAANQMEQYMGSLRRYKSYDEYLVDNHAQRGNNGLLKHQAEKFHIDNPDKAATYDYIKSGNDPEEGLIFS